MSKTNTVIALGEIRSYDFLEQEPGTLYALATVSYTHLTLPTNREV